VIDRRRALALGALVLAIVGLLAALGAFSGGDEKAPGKATKPAANAKSKAKARPQPAAKLPAGSEITQLLQTYADRFHDESALGIGELFADDAVRRNGDDPPENRERAIAAYRAQFAQLESPTYTLSELKVKRTPGAATVTGRYQIATPTGGGGSGGVVFRLVERDGHLVIRRLEITPD
jgi:hypothetical protein